MIPFKFSAVICFLLSFIFSELSAQESRTEKSVFHYYITLTQPESLNIEKSANGSLVIINPENTRETKLFSENKVLVFQPVFPNTQKEHLKKIYRISTTSNTLVGKLQNENPKLYTKIESYDPIPNAYYPNDYGTTSPIENHGGPYPLTGLDLINAPGAWGITTGNKKVVIGISDGKVDSTNTDLIGRVSNYMKYFNNTKGTVCYHGTGIAGIIGATMNNEYGIPGICSDCDLITHGYGRFDYIQELVEAGAKVINASWSLCGFGAYHQSVQERINEYYEEGILIVAAAGNGSKCNPSLRDYASNYTYPSSYKNVLSVTSVYAECGHYEDCVINDEQYGEIHYKLKDRHVRRQRKTESGYTPINSQFATQHNLSVDLAAPAETYSIGRAACGESDEEFTGLSSASAAFVTGVIGLIWSTNYCLSPAEVESILKLSSEDIEHLPGNEPFKMKLGAGRVDAYRAVKMANEMQQEKGVVTVSNRDFYRFDFELFSSPYQIKIQNQTFRDSSTVDFKARKRIQLKPGTHLIPDKRGFVKLSIDPDLPTEECFPTAVKPKPKVEKDSISNYPKFITPFEIKRDAKTQGLRIELMEGGVDTDYLVVIKTDQEVFRKTFQKTEPAKIPLENIKNETITITITTELYRIQKKLRFNFQ